MITMNTYFSAVQMMKERKPSMEILKALEAKAFDIAKEAEKRL